MDCFPFCACLIAALRISFAFRFLMSNLLLFICACECSERLSIMNFSPNAPNVITSCVNFCDTTLGGKNPSFSIKNMLILRRIWRIICISQAEVFSHSWYFSISILFLLQTT